MPSSALAVLALALLAQTPKTVTIEARDQDVREVLKSAFSQAGATSVVGVEVAGRSTVSIKAEPLEVALERILVPVDAAYYLQGGVYHVVSRVAPASPVRRGDTILNLRIVGRPIAEAVRSLPGREPVEIGAGVDGTVSLVAASIGYRDALARLADQTDARLDANGPILRLVAKDSLAKPIEPIVQADADLRAVVTGLMKSTGVRFIVSSGVAGKYSLDLKNMTVAEALEALLAPIGGRVVLRQGVFVVSAR